MFAPGGIWLVHVTLISLLIGAVVAIPQHEPMARFTNHFASARRTCGVLQAAYTTARGKTALLYPEDVRSDARILDLDRMVPEYRAKLALSASEFDELAMQAGRYSFAHFRPACKWKGKPGPSVDDEGHATFVTFTSPIFSNSGQFAIVEVSFREKGTFGYGLICVVRKRGNGWQAQCQNSWIT